MVFLCCVESSSASLSYAADFDSRSASVSRFDASSEEMRDFKELTSDSLEVEEDFKAAISDSRLDRIFSDSCNFFLDSSTSAWPFSTEPFKTLTLDSLLRTAFSSSTSRRSLSDFRSSYSRAFFVIASRS
ncbi:hypothetical protein BDV32DRAFT_123004 [Aspergillus pseudonomiae]|nr:hypothetical protein BDV32DRAFT_123004 [Aspergillus pseudonomiae]